MSILHHLLLLVLQLQGSALLPNLEVEVFIIDIFMEQSISLFSISLMGAKNEAELKLHTQHQQQLCNKDTDMHCICSINSIA
jgi:hypothetical protein